MYKIIATIPETSRTEWQTFKNGTQRQVWVSTMPHEITVLADIDGMSEALDIKAQLMAGGYRAYKRLTDLLPGQIDKCLGGTLHIKEQW